MEQYINENIKKNSLLEETQAKIELCKQYLKETDYAVIKMYETAMQGNSIDNMLQEYKEVLSKREECRALINELENRGFTVENIKN